MTTTAAAIIPVESQPTHLNNPTTKLPFIYHNVCSAVMSIIIIMTGTETTPLITALQNSALIGSSGEKLIALPSNVATAIVA